MMTANPTWLDKLLMKGIQSNGVDQPSRSNLNLLGMTVADNPGNDSTDVSVTVSGFGYKGFDVRNYGADPAHADNTTQIQAAINAAAAVGGFVYVPSLGTPFKCASSLLLPADVAVRGDYGSFSSATASCIQFTGATAGFIMALNAGGQSLERLLLIGGSSGGPEINLQATGGLTGTIFIDEVYITHSNPATAAIQLGASGNNNGAGMIGSRFQRLYIDGPNTQTVPLMALYGGLGAFNNFSLEEFQITQGNLLGTTYCIWIEPDSSGNITNIELKKGVLEQCRGGGINLLSVQKCIVEDLWAGDLVGNANTHPVINVGKSANTGALNPQHILIENLQSDIGSNPGTAGTCTVENNAGSVDMQLVISNSKCLTVYNPTGSAKIQVINSRIGTIVGGQTLLADGAAAYSPASNEMPQPGTTANYQNHTGLPFWDNDRKCLSVVRPDYSLKDPAWAHAIDPYNGPYFAKADGVTDDHTALNAAIVASAGSAPVQLGAGTYFINATLLVDNVNIYIRGRHRDETTVLCGAGVTGSRGLFEMDAACGNVLFEDLTLDGNSIPLGLVITDGSKNQRVTFRRCRFKRFSIALFIQGGQELVVEDCEFDGVGKNFGTAVNCKAVSKTRIQGNTFRWVNNAISMAPFSGSPTDTFCQYHVIRDNYFDGAYYTAPTTGLQGTDSTYTGTTLTTTQNMSAAVTSPASFIRALHPRLNNIATGVIFDKLLTDNSNDFEAAGILPGEIIAVGSTARGIVLSVQDPHNLYVEEWFDPVTGVIVPAPTGNYTAYHTWILAVLTAGSTPFHTVTAVNGRGWMDMAGNFATPNNGDLYEVVPLSNYFLITDPGVDTVIVEGNQLVRGRSDPITLGGNNGIVHGNDIFWSADTGVTLTGANHTVSDNWIFKPSLDGISIRANGCNVHDNMLLGAGWGANAATSPGGFNSSIFDLEGDQNEVHHNHCDGLGIANCIFAIVASACTNSRIEDNTVTNQASGHDIEIDTACDGLYIRHGNANIAYTTHFGSASGAQLFDIKGAGPPTLLMATGSIYVDLTNGFQYVTPSYNDLATIPAGVTVVTHDKPGVRTAKFAIDFSAFQGAVNEKEATLMSFPAKVRIYNVIADTTTAYTDGGGGPTISLWVGLAGAFTADWIALHDVKTATVTKGLLATDMGTLLAAGHGNTFGFASMGTTTISAYVAMGSGNTSALTGGHTDVYVTYEVLP